MVNIYSLLFILALALPSIVRATEKPDPFSAFNQVDPSYVMIAAHRHGYLSNGSMTHPENSLSAAQNSIALGVDILESDIRMTSDGGLVLMHDSTVNRTTNGSGTVSSMTLAQVRALQLLGPGGVVSNEIVPTLEELMLAVKGKVLVNLDKVNITDIALRDNVMAVLIATGTVDHAIFKGGATASQVAAMRAAYPGEPIIYMPLLSNSDETGMINMLNSHTPPATELIFSSSSTTMLSQDSRDEATSTDTHIWINSLWSSLCAGHHDSVALGGDPDGSWGWLIDKGATIIQTDNAPQMIPYLESRGLRGGEPVNRAPVAITQSVSTAKNIPLGITLTGNDLDGDSLAFSVIVDPQHGTLSGAAPNLTYTPDANYRGPDSLSFKVNDGTVDSNDPAEVLITVDPAASIHFDFDDGTMQGWVNTLQGGATENPNRFEARIDQSRGGGHSPDYSLMHDGNDTWLNGRDGSHDTLVASSPAFDFDEADPSQWEISFFLLGGTGDVSATPTSISALPASSATNGFMGVALRRISDGAYILHDRRGSSGQYDAWEGQGWSSAEITAAIAGDAAGETYQLDYIDQFHGSWGWTILDSVSIEGVVAPEVALLSSDTPLVTLGNLFLSMDNPLTDAPGVDDVVASSGSLFLCAEMRHGGGYSVLGLYPSADTSSSNGAIEIGRNATSSGFAVFDYLDNKGASSSAARLEGTPVIDINGGVYTMIVEIRFDSASSGTLRGWIHDGTHGSLDLASPHVETTFSSGFSTATENLFIGLGSASTSSWANVRSVWAGDGIGATREDAFSMLDPGPTYAGWAIRNILPTAPLLQADDPDHDSIANELEYFMGTDPGSSTNRVILTVVSQAEGLWQVEYQRADIHVGVTGSLQWSTDLINWYASGESDGVRTIEITESVIPIAESDSETVTATIETITGPATTHLFLRLQAQ